MPVFVCVELLKRVNAIILFEQPRRSPQTECKERHRIRICFRFPQVFLYMFAFCFHNSIGLVAVARFLFSQFYKRRLCFFHAWFVCVCFRVLKWERQKNMSLNSKRICRAVKWKIFMSDGHKKALSRPETFMNRGVNLPPEDNDVKFFRQIHISKEYHFSP